MPVFTSIHLRTVREQQLYHLGIAGARSRHKWRLTSGQRTICVGACLKEQSNHLNAAVGARQRERSNAVAIRSFDIGSLLQQAASAGDIIVVGGPVKRGCTVRVCYRSGPADEQRTT